MPRERLLPPPDSGRDHRYCVAHDCPLLGTFSPIVGGDRYCFVHDGLKATDWPATTAKMHQHDPLFRLMEKTSNAAPGEPMSDETRQALRDRGYGDAAVLPGTTARKFSQALRGYLLELVKPPAAPRQTLTERLQAASAAKTVGDFL